MARYEGRHRSAPVPSTAPRSDRATPTARSGRGHAQASGGGASSATPTTRHASRQTAREAARHGEPTSSTRRGKKAPRKRHVGRPILAGALALGLGASGYAYAKANDLIGQNAAAFVVGNGVVAQTDELARASTVDTTYRAAASVSRNERRTAIAATGSKTAQELEAKQKLAAAQQALLAQAAAAQAARDQQRQSVIDNAQSDPQSAARLLMADHGWSSDAQYNCLVNLWNGESDWRWSATNASSGAYGIPQSLPASKMAQFGADYRTNPLTQIKWGLWYIEMSYGNPCNAWSTWQARSPHWY